MASYPQVRCVLRLRACNGLALQVQEFGVGFVSSAEELLHAVPVVTSTIDGHMPQLSQAARTWDLPVERGDTGSADSVRDMEGKSRRADSSPIDSSAEEVDA